MMDYRETTEWLFSQVPMFQNLGAGAYKPGLDTTLALADAWNMPQKQFRSVHIAGTNGKGSTAHTVASILQAAGYKTGLYTSPHLLDFRERIRVDGVPVDEDYVVSFIDRYLSSPLPGLHPTFFELTTIMAFSYFAKEKVDVAVIEAGLGGRLDSTNIIDPELSVITNISYDHTNLLGNTLEKIAYEKAGIIKPHKPVVIGNADGEVREVFEESAIGKSSPLIFAQENIDLTATKVGDHIEYWYQPVGRFIGELAGDYQVENTRTVLASVEILRKSFPGIDNASIKKGFASVVESTGLMGRWMETWKDGIKVICDTGHNIGGWSYLGPRLQEISDSEGMLHIILGFVSDKDVSSIMKELPRSATFYFARPLVERGRPAEETAEMAAKSGLTGKVYATVADAYDEAMSESKPGDTVFVGGSTFVVADYLAHICTKA